MRHRRFWLAIVSAVMATQHNTSEAAAPVPDMGREQQSVSVQASAREEAVLALFEQADYAQVLETAGAIWPRLEAMPDRVLNCVAESYIRSGQVKAAKTGFEMLVARNPQNHNYRAGLAYTLVYGGELDRGIALYKQVLLANRGLLTVAAEDAVALLSQGNIGGGKALFQTVIALSPAKQQYVQLYESSLRAYGLTDNIRVAGGKERFAAAKPGTPLKNDGKLLPTKVTEPAGKGQYQLPQKNIDLQSDGKSPDKADANMAIVMLQQAGENERAVALYEQQAAIDMPFSVIKSASTAYFRLNKPDKAIAVLQPAIIRGDREALMWAGEMSLLRGNTVVANTYYDRLLSQNPNDFAVYFSRGMNSIQAKDYRQATRDLERARRLVPEGPERVIRLGQIEHDLAVAYIHSGQDAKAAAILVKYTKSTQVDSLIAGDYILALAKSGQYELAAKEGERLWRSYTEAPVLGLRSLAESYIQLGKQDQAIAVYRHIAERQSSDDADWRTLAFQLLLSGRTAEGLGHYDRLLLKPANVDGVVADANTLLNTDKYISGKTLFELVLRKYPDQAYRKQYAEALAGKNLNRAAYQQFQAMTVQPDGELAGLSGMVRSSLAAGDYQKFRQAFDTIIAKYGRSKAVAAVESSYQERQPGSVETTFDVAGILQEKKSQTPSSASRGVDAYSDQESSTAEADSRYAAIAKTRRNNADGTQNGATGTGYIDPETHQGLINEFMQVGKNRKADDEKVIFSGEVRYHYAVNSGPDLLGKNQSGLRTYFGADAKLNKDWHAYAMLENHIDFMNYDDGTKLSYLYAAGKVGEATVRAGRFGYLMAEGNIYDRSFAGVRIDVGDQLKYSLSYGKTDSTTSTTVATVRYSDYDYYLEAGVYHGKPTFANNTQYYTLKTIGGTYKFNDFSVGAMYLASTLKDSNGADTGYVYTLGYGDLREYRPGTFSLVAKYYNQPRGTYIEHGMNGRGATFMQGIKGPGFGAYYTLAKHLIGGIEYYSLTDKVTGDKGKTTWFQVTHYF